MAASYLAIASGFQAAIMAPTEVLASQHFFEFGKYFSRLGFKTVLLTGSVGVKGRREALVSIKDGSARMIVGTHALIQQGVEYDNLALIITDEQHRFGVNQRLSLGKKGDAPHTLVMTATPIPRTLGLILYGDMDVSIIDELPPGRLPVKTYCVNGGYRERVRGFIKREVGQGRQAYVICPAIEEGEPSGNDAGLSKADLKNVLQYTEELQHALPGINISALHGRMKPAEKNEIMSAFKAGELNVVVSTTVIEVGVHVDNATLMIIENAERFGLSQLHQLRGRVGRGQFESYCVLITDVKNEQTRMRMKAMTSTTDGFKLSELDLEQRGAGDFFGTRQHGLPAFTIANLYRDMDILQEAQSAAQEAFRGRFPLTEAERKHCGLRTDKVLKKAGNIGIL
jgi:ATP-dependent DNA helicase RecG